MAIEMRSQEFRKFEEYVRQSLKILTDAMKGIDACSSPFQFICWISSSVRLLGIIHIVKEIDAIIQNPKQT